MGSALAKKQQGRRAPGASTATVQPKPQGLPQRNTTNLGNRTSTKMAKPKVGQRKWPTLTVGARKRSITPPTNAAENFAGAKTEWPTSFFDGKNKERQRATADGPHERVGRPLARGKRF